MNTRQIENKVRHRLDNWKFWMLIAYFGLVFVMVWLFFLNRQTAEQAAARQAQQKAANTAQVADCYQALRNAPALMGILDSVDLLAESSMKSSKAALQADPDSLLTPVRRASIERLERAREGVAVFAKAMVEQTPTLPECNHLAARLGVDPSPYMPKPPNEKGDASP